MINDWCLIFKDMERGNEIGMAGLGLPATGGGYEAPLIEIVEVRVERGFMQSLASPDTGIDDDDYTW